MQRKFRLLREEAYQDGRESFSSLAADDPTFRDFVCMYIGEGYKRRRGTVSLANSDAAVVRLAARWIRRFASNPIWYRVQYHADQNLRELQEYWGAQLGVPPDDIRLQRKSNSSGLATRRRRSQFGVLTVGTNDTLLRSRLQAWIDLVKDSWV